MQTRLGSLTAAFGRLSSREQLMVLFVGFGLMFVVLFFGGFLVTKDLKAREARIAAKAKSLTELGSLRTDYARRLSAQNRLAEQIKQNGSVRLLSYIEEVGKAANVSLDKAAERPGQGFGEALKEEDAEVLVSNVSMDRLYDFLRRIEEGNALVKVRKLKVKKRYDNAQRLDATVTVGTFKLQES
ncbi:MAG: hypothetical protein HY791_39955 [Deltaproteobacteria bacterium]|nr:hypothetical protein [Deltaproteobacteria bacterium]